MRALQQSKCITSSADPGCLSRILDPNCSIPDSGSRVKKILDPGSWSASKNLSIFYPKICFSALGNMIRDVYPGSGSLFFTYPKSRIQESKRHRIPKPGSRIRNINRPLKPAQCWILFAQLLTLPYRARQFLQYFFFTLFFYWLKKQRQFL